MFNFKHNKQFYTALLLLLVILVGLSYFFYFVRNRIDLLQKKNNNIVFDQIYPDLLRFYEEKNYERILTDIGNLKMDLLANEERFKLTILQASTYKIKGDLLHAFRIVREAELIMKTPFSQTLKGMILQQIGEQEEAMKTYQTALELDQSFYPALEKLGDLHYKAARYDASVTYFSRAKLQSLEGDFSTANNQIFLKKILMEYLGDKHQFTRLSLEELRMFQETRYSSLISVVQGLVKMEEAIVDFQKNQAVNNKKKIIYTFEKAYLIANTDDKKYYLNFLALVNLYFENFDQGYLQLNQLVNEYGFKESQGIFEDITYEALGDTALLNGQYQMSKSFYDKIGSELIQQAPSVENRKYLIDSYLKQSDEIRLGSFEDLSDAKIGNLVLNEANLKALVHQLNNQLDFQKLVSQLNFSGLLHLSIYLEGQRYWDKLYQLYDYYFQRYPNAPPFIFKKAGDIAVHNNKLDKAGQWYEVVLKQSGNQILLAETYNNLSKIYLQKEDKQKAAEYIFSGLEFEPLSALYYNLALMQKSDGDILDYLYSLQKANSVLNKDFNRSLAAKIYLELSYLFTYAKVYKKAKYYLQKAEINDLNYARSHTWRNKDMLLDL